MNLFRIGLNFIVVVVLNSIERMRNESVFLLCISLLCCSALCQQYLFQATQGSKAEQAEMMAKLQGQDVPEDKLESGEGAGVASEEGGKTEAPVAGKSD